MIQNFPLEINSLLSASKEISVKLPKDENEKVIRTKYGFDLTKYSVDTVELTRSKLLGDILLSYGIDYRQIAELERKSKDVYSVRSLRSGKPLSVLTEIETGKAKCVIYEPNPFQYVAYDFRDSVSVRLLEKDYVSCIETASGTVESSLWQAMKDRGLNPYLIDHMEDALEWSVDFFHTSNGDEFKLVYEQKYIEGKPVGIGNLLGAYYKNNLEHYAIFFEDDSYSGFYDEEGRPTRKAFLKSPVKSSRISSFFSYSRFHPILKRRRPHLGTDYAAPYGTPIRAVANGVVETAGYTKGNGRYVKIKHDRTYQTQYLHMSKFAKGIRAGVHVKQNQTIGYVGSTGLATGPHVCFRFWKNGRQINHLRENFPSPEPMNEESLVRYFDVKDQMVSLLQQIEVSGESDSDYLAELIDQ